MDRLAIETGFVYKTVEAWERGERGPEPKHLVTLAGCLDVPPAELLSLPRDRWRLAELRATAGLLAKDVPALTGMSLERVRHIERGTDPLTPEVTDALALAYRSSPEEIRSCWQRARDESINRTTQ